MGPLSIEDKHDGALAIGTLRDHPGLTLYVHRPVGPDPVLADRGLDCGQEVPSVATSGVRPRSRSGQYGGSRSWEGLLGPGRAVRGAGDHEAGHLSTPVLTVRSAGDHEAGHLSSSRIAAGAARDREAEHLSSSVRAALHTGDRVPRHEHAPNARRGCAYSGLERPLKRLASLVLGVLKGRMSEVGHVDTDDAFGAVVPCVP